MSGKEGNAMQLITESRLVGDCKGWQGDTLFTLENGEVWQQEAYHYRYFYRYWPRVRIWARGSGPVLQIADYPERLPVRRVR